MHVLRPSGEAGRLPRGGERDPARDAEALVRGKEVLEHLDRAVDACDRVAGTLTHLAAKYG